VDDGSTDGTAGLVRAFASSAPDRVQVRLLAHERNRGKGAAVHTGCLAAQGEYVVFTDMDPAVPVEEVGRLLERLFAAQRLSGWAFDVELLYLAKRWGLLVEEVPVRWDHVAGSHVGLRPLVALQVLWDLLRLRLLHR
jgi:glycosyltransferase involved in cell wall biosynthesis